MAITPYLAITGAEFRAIADIPSRAAWMACHFSPYTAGLSNLPFQIPAHSLLIVDDVTPMGKHSPTVIAEQLKNCVENFQCPAVLLDFQRRHKENIHILVASLLEALPCPVIVSDTLASDYSCPVFLPPCPPYRPLEKHIENWKNREIWLEISRSPTEIFLTETGASIAELSLPEEDGDYFQDASLHCHYKIELTDQGVKFTLWRNHDDLIALLSGAEELGICEAVGLYQELGKSFREM